jgi:rhodanese-related sulfurtransferase
MSTTQTPFSNIHPNEALSLKGQALFLDVRTPAEFEDAHIDGATLHPVTDLKPSEVAKALQGKSCCVVVCGSGGRATKAAEQLSAAGISGLRVLEGGMKAWRAQDLPVIEGKKTISIDRQVRIGAGSLVVLGSVLALVTHPGWIALSAFVGAGLVFAGVTDTCGMALLLAHMPWNAKPKTACEFRPKGPSCAA